ncbi:MAG TPA: hypothetical protein VIV11_01875 [Kofleriaceae bacterium]
MTPTNHSSGEVAPRVRALIAAACAVTVIIAAMGMDSMWGGVEWVQSSERWGHDRSAFWYANGLAICLAIGLVLLYLPRFDVSRLLRVAVLMPIVHVIAIFVAGAAWSVLSGDVARMNAHYGWGMYNLPSIVLPSGAGLVLAFGALFAIAIAIKRRRGEWAHAGVMIALSYLLLLGLWLPILSRLSVSTPGPFKAIETFEEYGRYGLEWYWGWKFNQRLVSRETFVLLATIPPALIAISFTAIAFRGPRLYARVRRWSSPTVKLLLCGALLAALTLPNEAWLLYLESSYVVLFAVLLAIGALITLTVITRLGSLAAHFSFRRQSKVEGVIAHDDDQEAARFEITSWLRGPRLATRSFVVTTKHGSVPLDGVHVLSAVPASTTQLDIGEHAAVLRPGDRVLVACRAGNRDGSPFRAIDATEVTTIASPFVRPYRFSDVALVVWRPAVAYLAILIAVALPYLSIVLT